jgi:hypothetical protein
MPSPDLSLPISPHFTWRELLRSSTAERAPALKEEQENPPEDVQKSLQYLARQILEPIRTGLGVPLQITSGYRCVIVNKLVGGSATSQHCLGEAADCELSPSFLTDPATAATRQALRAAVEERTGRPVRPDVDQNFYLLAHVCLNLEALDIDQVIHEYGEGFGRPAWVHVSASERQNKRQVVFVGKYTGGSYVASPSVVSALERCCG